MLVTLWEIFNDGTQPWILKSNKEVADTVKSGSETLPQAQCPDYVYKIALACWKVNPSERPSFGEILKLLQEHSVDVQNVDYERSPSPEVAQYEAMSLNFKEV